MNAFHNAVQFLTEPGDGILLLTPTYYPMYNAVTANGRIIMGSSLTLKTDHYEIDFEDFERNAADPPHKTLYPLQSAEPRPAVYSPAKNWSGWEISA